jgi:hypothetical protein
MALLFDSPSTWPRVCNRGPFCVWHAGHSCRDFIDCLLTSQISRPELEADPLVRIDDYRAHRRVMAIGRIANEYPAKKDA